MEPIIVSVVAVVVGWFVTALVYSYDQGKKQGEQNERLDVMNRQLDTDRASYQAGLVEIRQEFRSAMNRLDKMFVDHDGNPRLMSTDAHRTWCANSHAVCAERFGRIVEDISKGETERTQRDHEIFDRLRKIERVMDQVAAKMNIKESQ